MMAASDLLDLAAVFVFALTGALAASRQQLDPIGFAFVACLTAVGGGTLRDVLLDRNPVFWIDAPSNIAAALIAAMLVFIIAPLLESRYRVLIWLDACALAVAVAAGVSVAMAADKPPLIVTIMGIITACMGGLMRDVVCNEVPLILKQGELYATAACAGSLAAVVTAMFVGDSGLALMAAAALTFGLRAGSLIFGWRLPSYRHRPPRT